MDAVATDKVTTEITSGAAATPGTKVSTISGPEHAVAVLKEKANLLHTLINNVGHVGSAAWEDIEALIADIKWVISYGRSATKK